MPDSRNPFVNQVNSDTHNPMDDDIILCGSQSLRKSGQFGQIINTTTIKITELRRNPFVNQVNSDYKYLVINIRNAKGRNPFVNQVNSDKRFADRLETSSVSQSLRKSGQFGRRP